MCLSAAGIFALLTVLQGLLPARRGVRPGRRKRPPRAERLAAGVRPTGPFVSFAAAMIASYVLSFQIYLALPLEVERLGGGESGRDGAVRAARRCSPSSGRYG